MNTVQYLFRMFILFLPAGFANMAPVLANKIPYLNKWKTPLDFGHKYKNQRVFGTNKTWRGLITGAIFAGIIALCIQWLFVDRYTSLGSNDWLVFIAGAWLGTGALVGDAVESFFKRQKGVPSGSSWFPFDQTDYIIGGMLFISPFIQLRLIEYATIFVMYFSLHLIVSYIGFLLGLKDKPI